MRITFSDPSEWKLYVNSAFTHVWGTILTLITILCICHFRAQIIPAFDRFDLFLFSLLFEMAFKWRSSADAANSTEEYRHEVVIMVDVSTWRKSVLRANFDISPFCYIFFLYFCLYCLLTWVINLLRRNCWKEFSMPTRRQVISSQNKDRWDVTYDDWIPRISVEEVNRNHEEVNRRMKQLQEANQAISLEKKALKKTVLEMKNKLKEIKTTCNELEHYAKRKCLELHGIPLTRGNGEEDTNAIVSKVGELLDFLREISSIGRWTSRQSHFKLQN